VRLALERYSALESGRGPVAYKELAARYSKDLPKRASGDKSFEGINKTIERAIGEAFVKRWVAIRQLGIIPFYSPDHELEKQLVNAFGPYNLKKAIVADIDLSQGSKADAAAGPEESQGASPSEIIHQQLGHAAATEIHETAGLFRSKNDIVAVGSGRAVHAVIDSLQQFEPFKVDDISIMSLTGSLFFQQTKVPQEYLLDADIHTALLAQRFAGKVHTLPTSSSIAHDKNNLPSIRRSTPLGQGYHNPTVAIIGVGTLSPGHRFHQVARNRRELEDEHRSAENNGDTVRAQRLKEQLDSFVLSPIQADLQHLINLSDAIGAECPGYNPVADVCNRLYFVPPPPAYSLLAETKAEIIAKIDNINDSLLTANKTQLDNIGTLILVAGTKAKARAIFTLLIRKLPKIDTLCVDADTANALLELVRNSAEVNAAVESGLEARRASKRT
jgi:DNA-binding transcriptional regulator LsrR (DeoR family)